LEPVRRRSSTVALPRRGGDRGLEVGGVARLLLLLARGELFLRHLVALTEILRALERNAHHVGTRPDACQIRVAPRGPGRRVRRLLLRVSTGSEKQGEGKRD